MKEKDIEDIVSVAEEFGVPLETDIAKKAPSQKRRRSAISLTVPEYATACEMFESGEFTAEEIAEHFDVETSTLKRRFTGSGLRAGSVPSADVRARAREALNFNPFEVAEMVRASRERTFNLMNAAENQVAMMLTNATKNKVPIGTYKDDLKALKDFVAIVESASLCKMRVLGVSKDFDFDGEEGLPSLVIEGMTEEEVIQARSNAEMDDLQLAQLEAEAEMNEVEDINDDD